MCNCVTLKFRDDRRRASPTGTAGPQRSRRAGLAIHRSESRRRSSDQPVSTRSIGWGAMFEAGSLDEGTSDHDFVTKLAFSANGWRPAKVLGAEYEAVDGLGIWQPLELDSCNTRKRLGLSRLRPRCSVSWTKEEFQLTLNILPTCWSFSSSLLRSRPRSGRNLRPNWSGC